MSKNEEKLSSTKYWIETTKSNFGTIVKDYLKEKKDFIVYIYGDHDEQGRSWCPDCVISEPLVEKVLPKIKEMESQKEIYFINVSVAFNNREVYRNDKIIKMKRIPTLIYFSKGVEMERLVEGEMATQENIDAFIDQIYEDL